MFANNSPYTPSPSPPSSPSFYPIDSSSPPSSPSTEPVVLDSPPPISLSHPFAASTKANRNPPQYEKRSVVLPITPPGENDDVFSRPLGFTATYPTFPKSREQDVHFNDGAQARVRVFSEDPERNIWDDAITKAVDTGNGAIRLSDHRLTYIPSTVGDLRNFYIPPETSEPANSTHRSSVAGGRLFSRVTTAPANTSLFPDRSAVTERTRSAFVDASVGLMRHEVHLYLDRNQIHNLPRELFTLTKMTVLILRGNKLTYLPPEIAQLTNLRELNVSSNSLQYLPSEMLDMSIKVLNLYPNPFLPEAVAATKLGASHPQHEHKRSHSMTRTLLRINSQRAGALLQNNPSSRDGPKARMLVSPPVHILPRIPSLVELTLRVLLSPLSTSQNDKGKEETALAVYYPLPLSLRDYHISEPLQETLNAHVPGAVVLPAITSPNSTPRQPRKREKDKVGWATVGGRVCAAPKHRSIFVQHAEERYTWEIEIAGCRVGGSIPVKWRGCAIGCLDFLDGKDEAGLDGDEVGEGDVEMLVDEDDGMEVVQVVSLGGEEFDFE